MTRKVFRCFLKTPFVSYLIKRFWFYSYSKNMQEITCLCLIKCFNNNQKQSKKIRGGSTEKFSLLFTVYSFLSFRNFLPRERCFTKQVAVTHRNTVISHLIYLKFAFAPFVLFQVEGYSSIKEIWLALVSCNLIVITTTAPQCWRLIIGLFKTSST